MPGMSGRIAEDQPSWKQNKTGDYKHQPRWVLIPPFRKRVNGNDGMVGIIWLNGPWVNDFNEFFYKYICDGDKEKHLDRWKRHLPAPADVVADKVSRTKQ